ncbi:Mu transposase, C-terminal [Devosia enhydra]|uniref:Mu transposase, C-terminal n=1 Tax=Devosia enhydra TaxID=665118 RepID=A0A1K2I0R8_9HYPH|nr:Mu transposase C-terminal domain-containing protein [Devosia enhydra]SFZ85966.1 Mu transposase, C-terminal [Devosia enhydra]
MKEWLTAREIADAQLRDVPNTTRGVAIMAERERWDEHPTFARRRQGRGGGMEYNYRILPTLAQLAWFQRHDRVAAAEPSTAKANLPPAGAGTQRAQRERDARLAILAAFERFSRGLRPNKTARLKLFCDKYNLGTLAIDAWIKDTVPVLSMRSLDRWAAKAKAGDAIGHDPSLSRKGTSILERANGGRVIEWMLALIAFEPHLKAEAIQTQCRHKFGDTLELAGNAVPMPNVRAFQRALKALKADPEKQLILTKITNPDRFRSAMRPSGTGMLAHIHEPNALWMVDASPMDALCIDGRHSIYACIDVATRRLAITVSRTPRASAVALLVRKAALAWGVPRQIRTDNGSDFVARDTKRLLAALNIEIEVCPPYAPEHKAHVERAIKTFQHMVGPELPGFIGHNVTDRKAIEERRSFASRLGEDDAKLFSVRLTAAELQRYIDQWIEVVYQHRAHSGLKGQTPALAAASAPNYVPRMVDERAFDLLLMPVAGGSGNGLRKVGKQGIRVDHFHYAHPSLAGDLNVLVRMDPLDLGKVYVFAADGGSFLCEAICPELAGIDPAAFHQARREILSERLANATKGIRADMREIGLETLIAKTLQVKARDIPNVVPLPRRSVEHTTPQIDAAIAAMSPAAPVPLSDDVSAMHQALLAELDPAQPEPANSNVTPLRRALTPAQLFRKALGVEEQLAAGQQVPPEDLIWFGGFKQSADYQTMKMMHEEFGDQALR